MKELNLKEFYARSLELQAPWKVAEVLPDSAIVFDRFHIKMHLNEAVDKVRRQEHRKLSAAGNLILSDSRYLSVAQEYRRSQPGGIQALSRPAH